MAQQRTPVPRTGTIKVTLVTSAGCHLCGDAREHLDALSQEFDLQVTEVDLAGSLGSEIARRYRVPFPPVILLNGRLHGYGRISAKKLRRDIESIRAERED